MRYVDKVGLTDFVMGCIYRIGERELSKMTPSFLVVGAVGYMVIWEKKHSRNTFGGGG